MLGDVVLGQLERMLGAPGGPAAWDAQRWRDDKQVQLVYPLAWAYAHAEEGSPWRRCPAVLDAVNGLATWAFSAETVGRRVPFAFCRAYGVLRGQLGRQEQAWRDGLAGMMRGTILPALREREHLTQFTSANVGYGTNHLIYEVAGLAAYIALFRDDEEALAGLEAELCPEDGSCVVADRTGTGGRAASGTQSQEVPSSQRESGKVGLVEYAEGFLRRFMDYMHADGYWVECDGPATSYNMLSAHCAYLAALDLGVLDVHRDRLARAAWFNTVTMFPNLDMMPVTNGRSQFRKACARPAFLSLHPEGAPLQQAVVEHYRRMHGRGDQIGAQELVYLLDSYRVMTDRPAEAAGYTWAGGDRSETLSDDFAIVRRCGWIAAVSNVAFRPRPEGHFNLDYTGLLSLYHDAFGTVLYGANSKNDPLASTFHKQFDSFDSQPLPAGKRMPVWIPDKGRFDVRDDGVGLFRDYRGFEGRLDFRAIDDRNAVVSLRANARRCVYPIEAALMPALRYGQVFADGTGRTHTVAEAAFRLTGAELGGTITLQPEPLPNCFADVTPRPVTLRVPDDAVLHWPHAMWNPYGQTSDWYEDPEDWVVLLLVPVGTAGARVELRVD